MESTSSADIRPSASDFGGLLDRLLTEAEGGAQAPPPPSPPELSSLGGAAAPVSSDPTAPGGGLLGSLLGNPALLTALPVLAENLGPLLAGMSGGVGSSPTATRPHAIDRHTALLCAVKPYLSPQRQEAAETVIRLCRVWDALERSGISLTGLLSGAGRGMQEGESRQNEGEVT